MLNKLQKRKNDQKGFTIIEVLIVLAIAGLILLIVFLAVPALQRNSRDTSRKNDISRILGGAQEVINNNNGAVTGVTATQIITAAGTLGYYDAANVSLVAIGTSTPSAVSDVDTVVIYTGATCSTGGKAIKGSSRQVAIEYRIESAGGTPQCTNS